MSSDPVVSWPVDHTVLAALDQAMRRKHLVTQCTACGGPLVHSRLKTPREGTRLTADVPPSLQLRLMNGQVSFNEFESLLGAAPVGARCFRCGSVGATTVVRPTWRKCKLCGSSMAGTSRDAHWCPKCAKLSSRARAKRMRWKSEREAKEGGVGGKVRDGGNAA